jgi:HSP20 family protein
LERGLIDMATLVRFDPFRELAGFQSDVSRLLNGMVEGNGRTTQAWVPALDVWETGDEIVLAFDLPGVAEDEIAVELEDDMLTVSAVRERTQETDGEGVARYERRFGTFTRTIGLPQGVGDADVQATYKDGVLELHVRKPEQRKPRRIQVGTSQPSIEGAATKE